MTRYRPSACSGQQLAQCEQCLRHDPAPAPYRVVIVPEVVDGHCEDQIAGTPPAPRPNLMETSK
jgi:hypothetical protein